MGNETRVNIRHLLEDLRDTYAAPLEEAIVTELIANALDGGATSIMLSTDRAARAFRCADNGEGMNRAQLRSYHNIAASTKERGFGIGFAGVGAKLSLLLSESVTTESRGKRGARAAALWHLKDAYRAPWKYVPFSGSVEGRGTAVTLRLKEGEGIALLDPSFLERTVKRHFYPLIVEHEGLKRVLRALYRKQITITINGAPVAEKIGAARDILIRKDKSRALLGAGFLERARMDQNFWRRFLGKDPERPREGGLKISTYGKVIKGGWEWLGILPKNPELVSGVVEIPELSSLLTTNKADFLTDAASLKKYYKIRKKIQSAVRPILKALGESKEESAELKTPASWKPLTRNIESALLAMSRSFPELESLVGTRFARAEASEGELKATGDGEVSIPTEGASAVSEPREEERATHTAPDTKRASENRARRPGLTLVFEPFAERAEKKMLGKLLEETIFINTAHPAWKTAEELHHDHYHALLTVALVLAEEMRPGARASEFVSAFLRAWSEAAAKAGRLF